MNRMPDLESERAYAAEVQQLLTEALRGSEQISQSHVDSILEMIRSAWVELRTKPTAYSVQEMETLRLEVNRYLSRKSLSDDRIMRCRRMLTEPYFARIDFKEDGTDEAEPIIIGLYSLVGTGARIYVHDWRAPIAGLYYDSEPGRCGYTCPDGDITGEMTLKRQYGFSEGRLRYYVDTTYSIDDALLLDILSRNVSDHMHSIVNTIQKEQNRAIRYEDSKVVLITGCAGSGKTSVAMHRAAYLLYRRRETLTADRVLILSPSPVFSEYISTVLPEMGEENIRTGTMYETVKTILGENPEHPLTQAGRLLSAEGELRRRSVAWKYSPEFFRRIRDLLDAYAENGPEFQDITFKGRVLLSAARLKEMYDAELRVFSPAQRLSHVAAQGESLLHSIEESVRPRYMAKFEGRYKGKELAFMVNLAVSQYTQPARVQLTALTELSPRMLLKKLLQDAPEDIRIAFDENCAAGIIWWEDALCMALFSAALGFAAPDRRVRHLIIDEVQDQPDIALMLLRRYYAAAEVTALGDPAQRTTPGMPACDPEGWRTALEAPDAPLLRLDRAYRSTLEINRFTNSIAGMPDAGSIGRTGAAPRFIAPSARNIQQEIAAMREAGLETIAVLTRTPAAADTLSRRLKDVFLLDEHDNRAYRTGDTIVTCFHLAKGMEFDGVIVAWDDAELTPDERRRLYTAGSRALHRLTMAVPEGLADALKAYL